MKTKQETMTISFSLKEIDKERIKVLKEHGINISFILRECIKEHYQKIIQ